MKELISNDRIQTELGKTASVLNDLFVNREDIVCVPILQGGVRFFVDLSSKFAFNPVVKYAGVSSYDGMFSREIDAYKLPKREDVEGKTVLVFDDILDTGNTMDYLINLLFDMGAKEVIPVFLLGRETRTYQFDPRIKNAFELFTIGEEWVFGYGMDNPTGHYRTLNYIAYES